MTEGSDLDPRVQGSDSGVVAGRDASLSGHTVAGRDLHMRGTHVAGRDVVVHQHLEQVPSAPLALFQLPPDTEDFINRKAELAHVCRFAERKRPLPDTALTVVAIAGKPGVGKTTLAIRAAHQLSQYFPDGQLYVNLRGAEAQRLEPDAVLADLLSILGVDRSGIPDSLDGRARLYRDRLANRRVLVLLDNAAEPKQVRPLLPGSPSCAVLVTSRGQLVGLAAYSLVLEVFNEAEAVHLLRKMVGRDQQGADRVRQEPDAVLAIARSCGCLPLALSIAAAKLVLRRQWRLEKLVKRLHDEGRRLRELEIGDLEVRAIFALSYQDLPQEEQQAFRLLGLLPASDFAAWTAAALLDRDPDTAEDLLDRLVDAQLLENHGEDATGQIRYRFHDLIRDFAREQLAGEAPEAEQQAALERVLNAYLNLARKARAALEARDAPSTTRNQDADNSASRQLDVIQALRQDPVLWFRLERANLVAAVEQASQAQQWSVATGLAGALDALFRRDAQWTDWQRTQDLALHAARQHGDQRQEAIVHRNLGSVYWEQGHWDAAVTEMQAALEGFGELGDRREMAITRLELGRVHRERSQWNEALACFDAALSEFGELNEPAWEGATLRSRGKLEFDRGQLDNAQAFLHQALLTLTDLGDHHGVALTVRDRGLTCHAQGRLDEAARYLEQAIAEFEQLGDRRYEYVTHADLGKVQYDQGRLEAALDSFERARAVFRELGDRRWEAIALVGLGKLHRDQGRLDTALEAFEQAQTAFAELNDRLWQARAVREIGSIRALINEPAMARDAWETARKVFQDLDVPEAIQVPTWLR